MAALAAWLSSCFNSLLDIWLMLFMNTYCSHNMNYQYLWKPIIINVIGTRTIRFGQLDSIVPHISRKVLAEQLKELEEDGLLERLAYKELPPRVDYKLSEKGLAFLPILDSIKEWNLKYEVVS